MGLRIRKDLTIVCAADQPEKKGDTYVPHGLHYLLKCKFKVLHTDDGGLTWYFGKKRHPSPNKRKGGSESERDLKIVGSDSRA